MSGASTSQNPDTAKQTTDDSTATPSALQQQQPKQPAQLEEDDEFEDFPVEGTTSLPIRRPPFSSLSFLPYFFLSQSLDTAGMAYGQRQ